MLKEKVRNDRCCRTLHQVHRNTQMLGLSMPALLSLLIISVGVTTCAGRLTDSERENLMDDSIQQEIRKQIKKYMNDMVREETNRRNILEQQNDMDEEIMRMVMKMKEERRHSGAGAMNEKKQKKPKRSLLSIGGLHFSPVQGLLGLVVVGMFVFLMRSNVEDKERSSRLEEQMRFMELKRRADNESTEQLLELQRQMTEEKEEGLRLEIMEQKSEFEKRLEYIVKRQDMDRSYLQNQQMQNMFAISWAMQRERQQQELFRRSITNRINRAQDNSLSPAEILPAVGLGAVTGARFGPWGAVVGGLTGLATSVTGLFKRNRR